MQTVFDAPLLHFGVVLCLASCTTAQFVRDSQLYQQELSESTGQLLAQLQNHPDLEDIYFPGKYDIPTQFYRFRPPVDYTQNVIFDPCRDQEYDCCKDTYGTPEFRRILPDGTDLRLRAGGEQLPLESSRLPTDSLEIDELCTGERQPFDYCVRSRVARKPYPLTPRCWNNNATIVADRSCRSPMDGSSLPLCLELAVTQTAYIVECGGTFRRSQSCGTFLEVHRPGSEEVLAQARLRGQYTSGYRMAVMTTTHGGRSNRTLCEGRHELWWVHRTRYEYIVEKVMPFEIVSPLCDWDAVNDRFLEYATVPAVPLTGLDPYAPSRFVEAHTRTFGTPGYPGKGMGPELRLFNRSAFPQSARFQYGSPYEYDFTPATEDLTVKEGELWESHPESRASQGGA